MNTDRTPLNQPAELAVSPAITAALDSLRGKIRQYVLVHGLMLAVIWLCVSFWLALALDYLPVLLGFAELPRVWRLVMLIGITVILAVILYRWVWSRVRRRLRDESLAMLLERRFPELNDALVTVVQAGWTDGRPAADTTFPAADRAGQLEQQRMLDEVRTHAERTLKRLSLTHVFNFRPLLLTSLAALLLTTSVSWFAIARQPAFTTALRRLYLLDATRWPRECHIQLVGVRVRYEEPVAGIPEMNQPRAFADDEVTVALAADISLLIRAEMPDPSRPDRRLPGICEFIYRTADGQRGRLPFSKIGGARDGYQAWSVAGDVLERVAGDIRFYVRGGDHTIGPFRIRAIDPPVVTGMFLDCDFPDYLVDPQSSRFTARRVAYTPGMQLPVGTTARLLVETDAAVQQGYVLDAAGGVTGTADRQEQAIAVRLDELQETVEFGLVIRSHENVFSPRPLKFRIAAEEDKPPQITSSLPGIGTAVTPDARIPVSAEITDKHGVERTWIELETPLTGTIDVTQPATEGSLQAAVDLRQMRITGDIPDDLPTEPASEIALTVVAKDHFDLRGGENIGVGSRHPLELVTADRLLRLLERAEAEQRFRLEQIYQEMSEARGYIGRARTARNASGTGPQSPAGLEPEDQLPATEAATISPEDWDLRQLFVQRALLQVRKSQQEIEGVAFTFDHIRQQLVNNRIDAEDRKLRLQQDVALPLKQVAGDSLPALEKRLLDSELVLQKLIDPASRQATSPGELPARAEAATLQALTEADRVLSEIQDILNSLLKFETQNELLDLVRRMLEQQQALQKRTSALRNREAFDDIFNQ
jgi:hypothetical protein